MHGLVCECTPNLAIILANLVIYTIDCATTDSVYPIQLPLTSVYEVLFASRSFPGLLPGEAHPHPGHEPGQCPSRHEWEVPFHHHHDQPEVLRVSAQYWALCLNSA